MPFLIKLILINKFSIELMQLYKGHEENSFDFPNNIVYMQTKVHYDQ